MGKILSEVVALVAETHPSLTPRRQRDHWADLGMQQMAAAEVPVEEAASKRVRPIFAWGRRVNAEDVVITGTYVPKRPPVEIAEIADEEDEVEIVEDELLDDAEGWTEAEPTEEAPTGRSRTES